MPLIIVLGGLYEKHKDHHQSVIGHKLSGLPVRSIPLEHRCGLSRVRDYREQ